MRVFKTKNGANTNYWQDELPSLDKYDEALGVATIDIGVFKKNAPMFVGNYHSLLEACYKEQLYNEAVATTLASYKQQPQPAVETT